MTKVSQAVLSMRLAIRRLLTGTKYSQSQSQTPRSPGPQTPTHSFPGPSTNASYYGIENTALLGLLEATQVLAHLVDVHPAHNLDSVRKELTIATAILNNEHICSALRAGLATFGLQGTEIGKDGDDVNHVFSDLPQEVLAQFNIDRMLPQLPIEVAPLEHAIDLVANSRHQDGVQAKHASVLVTNEAKLLYSTAQFMRSLRLAVKLNHMSHVCALLSQCDMNVLAAHLYADDSNNTHSNHVCMQMKGREQGHTLSLHVCVCAEIYFLKHCVSLRECALQLRDALQVGGPMIDSASIVHTKSVDVGELELAISNLATCLHYFKTVNLGGAQSHVDNAATNSQETELDRVLSIAHAVVDLRKCLMAKQWEQFIALSSGNPFVFDIAGLFAHFTNPTFRTEEPVCGVCVQSSLRHEWTDSELDTVIRAVFTMLCRREITRSLRILASGHPQQTPSNAATEVKINVHILLAPQLLQLCRHFDLLDDRDIAFGWMLETVKNRYEQYMSCRR
jgi:hypothetical protein